MADRDQGDAEFAATCRSAFENGSQWLDANLFNGEYYIHKSSRERPEADPDGNPARRDARSGRSGAKQSARVPRPTRLRRTNDRPLCGLGHLLEKSKIRHCAIERHEYNCPPHFSTFQSPPLLRPRDDPRPPCRDLSSGKSPDAAFPYCNEVWTGLEYTAAAGMLYEGIRRRAESHRRRRARPTTPAQPLQRAECGHHYARAMASWATILALTGFEYDAIDQKMTFADAKPRGQMVLVNRRCVGGDETKTVERPNGADVGGHGRRGQNRAN